MDCETTNPSLLRDLQDPENERAWNLFVESYQKPIVQHCIRCGLTSDQAAEVTQECFIKCFRYLPQLDYSQAVGRFRAWLNLLVNQQIGEHYRRSIRQEETKRRYETFLREFAPNASGDPASGPTSYDYELLAMALQRTRGLVDPKHWQVFEAYLLHELPSNEVTQHFGVNPIAVRVITHRTKALLQKQWKALQDGPF